MYGGSGSANPTWEASFDSDLPWSLDEYNWCHLGLLASNAPPRPGAEQPRPEKLSGAELTAAGQAQAPEGAFSVSVIAGDQLAHSQQLLAQQLPQPSRSGVRDPNVSLRGCRLPKGPLICQVHGCGKSLTEEKGYYQRYRICKVHLAMGELIVDGQSCRFCQQCGRFHDLSEFDGDRRSCRSQLQHHNARRFAKRAAAAAAAAASDGSEKPARARAVRRTRSAAPPTASSSDTSGDASLLAKALPTPAGAVPQADLAGLDLLAAISAENGGASPAGGAQQQKAPGAPPSLPPVLVPPPQHHPFPAIVVEPPRLLQHQPSDGSATASSFADLSLSGKAQAEAADGAVVTGVPIGYAPVASVGGGGAAGPSAGPQALGATGAAAAAAAAALPPPPADAYDLARSLVQSMGQEPYSSDDVMLRLSLKIGNCRPEQLPPDLYMRLKLVLDTAEGLLLQGFLRPGCTHLLLDVLLPADVSSSSSSAALPGACGDVGAALLTAPAGCVSEQALAAEAAAAGGAGLGPVGLVDCLGPQLQAGPTLVQLGSKLSLVRGGAVVQAGDLPPAEDRPVLLHATPAAVVNAAAGTATFCVYGRRLTQPGAKLFVRSQGQYLRVLSTKVLALPQDETAPLLRGCDALQLTVRCRGPRPALAAVEVQHSAVLGGWLPLLLADPDMAAEVCQLGAAALHGKPSDRGTRNFVADLGRQLDFAQWLQGPVDAAVGGSAAAALRRGERFSWGSGAPSTDSAFDPEASAAAGDALAFGLPFAGAATPPARAGSSLSRGSGDAAGGDDDGGAAGAAPAAAAVVADELLQPPAQAQRTVAAELAQATTAYYGRMMRGAVKLLAFCAERCMLACCNWLVDLLASQGVPGAMVLQSDGGCGGLGVAHRCMRTGCRDMAAALVDWASRLGHALDLADAGPMGVTPLHLLAVADSADAAAAMLDALPAAALAPWFTAAAHDGRTPSNYATTAGLGALNDLLRRRLASPSPPPSPAAAAAAAVAAAPAAAAPAAAAAAPPAPTHGAAAAAAGATTAMATWPPNRRQSTSSATPAGDVIKMAGFAAVVAAMFFLTCGLPAEGARMSPAPLAAAALLVGAFLAAAARGWVRRFAAAGSAAQSSAVALNHDGDFGLESADRKKKAAAAAGLAGHHHRGRHNSLASDVASLLIVGVTACFSLSRAAAAAHELVQSSISLTADGGSIAMLTVLCLLPAAAVCAAAFRGRAAHATSRRAGDVLLLLVHLCILHGMLSTATDAPQLAAGAADGAASPGSLVAAVLNALPPWLDVPRGLLLSVLVLCINARRVSSPRLALALQATLALGTLAAQKLPAGQAAAAGLAVGLLIFGADAALTRTRHSCCQAGRQ